MNNICKNFGKLCFSSNSINFKNELPTICDRKYTLEKTLQSGYSGKVFYGHYNQTPVVIKCCRKFSSWKVEVNALNMLKHENIIKLVGIPESNILGDKYTVNNYRKKKLNNCSPKIHILAQEFAKYGDLHNLLEKHGWFEEKWARTFVLSILKGLIYAYEEKQISHRDVKLENIFISDKGIIKIGDWGLSAFNTVDRLCSTSCGTFGYMSPNMICNQKYDSNKTDVWSLGVLLFSLCSCVRPYEDPCQQVYNICNNIWMDPWLLYMVEGKWKLWWKSHQMVTPIINNFSNELCDLIVKMFCIDEKKRISLSEIINHDWMKGDTYSNEEVIELCKQHQVK
jgi:serine/threonine protein kinase